MSSQPPTDILTTGYGPEFLLPLNRLSEFTSRDDKLLLEVDVTESSEEECRDWTAKVREAAERILMCEWEEPDTDPIVVQVAEAEIRLAVFTADSEGDTELDVIKLFRKQNTKREFIAD